MNTTQIIYLVDDDPDDRFFIRQALMHNRQEVEVVEATSGFELLTLIEQQGASSPATLILMDMNMPKMSGVETMQVMRSNPGLPVIPVVMISTTTNPNFIESAFAAGVAGFLPKPSSIKGFSDMADQLRARYLG